MMHESKFVHYQTGVVEHDVEHWDLLMLMNELVNALQNKTDATTVFNQLLTSLSNHFEHEQQYMADVGFPYVESHTADHSRMIRTLWQTVEHVRSQSPIVVQITVQQLEKLFIDHIDHFDMQYVDWVKSHNGC